VYTNPLIYIPKHRRKQPKTI